MWKGTKSDLSDLEKGPLERFKQTRLLQFISTLPGSWEALCQNREKVTEQFWSKWPKCKKSKIWPYRPWKMTFRAIQTNLSFDMWFMSPQRSSMPKNKKSYWSVSEIDPFPPPPPPPQSWRMDRRTDRWTTDKSVLEKLRCLSVGGAKNIDRSEGVDNKFSSVLKMYMFQDPENFSKFILKFSPIWSLSEWCNGIYPSKSYYIIQGSSIPTQFQNKSYYTALKKFNFWHFLKAPKELMLKTPI